MYTLVIHNESGMFCHIRMRKKNRFRILHLLVFLEYLSIIRRITTTPYMFPFILSPSLYISLFSLPPGSFFCPDQIIPGIWWCMKWNFRPYTCKQCIICFFDSLPLPLLTDFELLTLTEHICMLHVYVRCTHCVNLQDGNVVVYPGIAH